MLLGMACRLPPGSTKLRLVSGAYLDGRTIELVIKTISGLVPLVLTISLPSLSMSLGLEWAMIIAVLMLKVLFVLSLLLSADARGISMGSGHFA